MHRLLATALAASLALSSVASAAAPPPAPAATPPGSPVKVQLPKPTPGTPAKPKAEGPATVSPEDAKGPDRKKMAGKGLFQLDFDKVDIDKLVQTISDMTGKLFILPENVRGKITIVGPEHGKAGVTADEAYAAFLSALDANGLTLYPAGKYLKIVEKRAGKQSNIPTMLEEGAPYTTNEQMVTKLFKLRYVEAEPVRAVVQQLVSRDGDTIAFPPDTIIVNDIGLNMHRLEKIIDRLDSVTTTDEIRIIQVQYATATEIAEKLRQVFEEKNKKPGQKGGQAVVNTGPSGAPPAPAAPQVGESEAPASLQQIIADERSNKLIVIANERAFNRIQELLRHLDTPIPGEGQVHVYYLVNANAEELASTLASLTQGINKQARPSNPPPGAAKGPATVADLFSGEVKITADKGTNSLVVIANNSDYRNLVSVVEKLDISRRQVFIEAVIMEVNLSNDLSFGMGMHFGDSASIKTAGDSLLVTGSELGKSNSLSGVLSLASLGGFLAGLQGPLISDKFPIPAFSIVLHALQSNSDVNVISTPHILATDNEDAEITVGQNVPFQAGITSNALSSLGGATGTSSLATSALLGSYSGLIAPIQRQNVELKLKIKPQINESDFIRLQVDEQTEEIASKDDRLGPTTAKRTAKTTVVARDQQTIVIGGLIQERTVKSVQKVPLLGDIPVLGWLFRDNGITKQRTNLLLFLTPYIIRDQADFQRIFERKLKERQEFVEQFYGRQAGYKVPIDYNRKAGPLAKMFHTMETEAKKYENGGSGLPSEKLFKPKGDSPKDKGPTNPPPPSDLKSTPPGEPATLPPLGGGPEVKEPASVTVQ
ncbi:MAG TPA: type II secretion system secretin GspD [Myxococcales bacterium]|jgi:general secretion pathway protein D